MRAVMLAGLKDLYRCSGRCLCVCLRAQKLRRGVWRHAFPILRRDCSWHSAARAAHALRDVYTHSFIITQSNMVIKASARVKRSRKDTVLELENVSEYITAMIKNKRALSVFLPMSFTYLFMGLFTIKAVVCSVLQNCGRHGAKCALLNLGQKGDASDERSSFKWMSDQFSKNSPRSY